MKTKSLFYKIYFSVVGVSLVYRKIVAEVALKVGNVFIV